MSISVAAIFGVLETIDKVAGAVKGVYDLVKIVDELISGASDWDQVRAVISTQITIRNQILEVSGGILDAIAQLDRRIFLENMADKLGDSDQAILALDTWQRTGDAGQRAIALSESAGALADLLRYANNNVYPVESLVFPLIEVLAMRVLILREADPAFAGSPVSRRPIEGAIQLVRATADSLESAVLQANVIRDRSGIVKRVRQRPADEGGGRETVSVLELDVSYRNIDGSVTFQRRGEFLPEDGEPQEIIDQAKADAAPVRGRGLALDLARARVTELREIADMAERALLVSEMLWLASVLRQHRPTKLETAYYVARRRRASFAETASRLLERAALDRSALESLARMGGRPLDGTTVESLWNVAQALGPSAVVRLLLSDAVAHDELVEDAALAASPASS